VNLRYMAEQIAAYALDMDLGPKETADGIETRPRQLEQAMLEWAAIEADSAAREACDEIARSSYMRGACRAAWRIRELAKARAKE